MEALLDDWQSYLLQFFPVWVRFTAFWPAAPLLGQHVPAWAKIGLSMFLAFILVPYLPARPEQEGLWQWILPVASEALTGLLLGFVVNMILGTVYLAGQLIDLPIGFSMAAVFDPHTGLQTPIMAQFLRVVAVLVMFMSNGHHELLQALAASFQVVPVGGMRFDEGATEALLNAFAGLFLVGLRIALPVVAALLVTDIALGIVTRAVPQINVFVIGFPIKIVVGLFILLFTMPALVVLIGWIVGAGGQLVETLWRITVSIGDGL